MRLAVCGAGVVCRWPTWGGRGRRVADTLVLSLFPGLGLLDMAFEQEGFCVVRGPDLLWGGDIRRFSPPAGVFGLVIGGPPCQAFSRLRYLNPNAGTRHGNLIPEFERVVREARPRAFLMENVPEAPEPEVPGYVVRSLVLNNRWMDTGDGIGAEQHRVRRFSFGTEEGLPLRVEVAVFESPSLALAATSNQREVPVKVGESGKVKRTYRPPTVLSGHGAVQPEPGEHRSPAARTLAQMCRLQGLPEDFLDESPFTVHGKRQVVGNGVPLPMGRAIARAVRRALGLPLADTGGEEAAG